MTDIGTTAPLSPAVHVPSRPEKAEAPPEKAPPARGVRRNLEAGHYGGRAYEVLSAKFGTAPGEADFERSPKAIVDSIVQAGSDAMSAALDELELTDGQATLLQELSASFVAEATELIESRPGLDALQSGLAAITEELTATLEQEIPPPLADQLREIFEGLIDELQDASAQIESEPPQVALAAYAAASAPEPEPSTVDTAA